MLRLARLTEYPIEQTIDGNRRPSGIGEIVVTTGNLPSAPCQFPRRKAEFQNQRRNEAVAKQRDFLGFGIHLESLSSSTLLRCRPLLRFPSNPFSVDYASGMTVGPLS